MSNCYIAIVFLYLFVFNTIKSNEACDRRTSQQQEHNKVYTNINDLTTPTNIYTPAEINDMDALFIGWPRYQYHTSHSATGVVLEMISALCNAQNDNVYIKSTRIIIQVPHDLYNDALNTLTSEGLINCVEFNFENRDDIWIRDMGPVFTYYNEKLSSIDFDFDFWSGEEQAGEDFKILEESLDRLIYYNYDETSTIINTCLVSEGGNREFNGDGILMMNQNVEELRNVGDNLYTQWTLTNSESEYKKLFGVDMIIWLTGIMSNDQIVTNPSYGPCDDCIAFGWGTGGHIDEIARFVNDNTIVILKITDTDIARDEYSNGKLEEDKILMDANIEYLKNNFDDLNVIEIPLAPTYWVELTENDETYYWYEGLPEFDALVENGEIIYEYGATSYLNFVVTNQAVLIPKYYVKGDKYLGYKWIKENDKEVLEIMEQLFEDTGRKVIQINPVNINIGGGGMHCITAHQPSLDNAFLLGGDDDDDDDDSSGTKSNSVDSSSTENALFGGNSEYDTGYSKSEVDKQYYVTINWDWNVIHLILILLLIIMVGFCMVLLCKK